MSKTTLADKISSLLTSAPKAIDPDNDETDQTSAKVTEASVEDNDDNDEDLLLSNFRRKNIELLENIDRKYTGKKVSRRDLQDSDDEFSDDDKLSEDDGSSEAESENEGKVEIEEEESVDDTNDEEEESADDINDEEEESVDGTNDEEEESNGSQESESEIEGDEDSVSIDDDGFQHMTKTDVAGQIKKGQCVKNQINIWENLVEMRIQTQKCLINANRMPSEDLYGEISKNSGVEFTSKVNETKKTLCTVLDRLLDLQSLFWKRYPETKGLLGGGGSKRKVEDEDDEEIPSDTEDEEKSEDENDDKQVEEKRKAKKRLKLSDYEEIIKERDNKYKNYRNETIKKWNDKTRISSKSNVNSYTVLNQIEHILSDRQRLIKKSQTRKSSYEIVGVGDEMEVTEIYDDDDFYHQMLRELIEVKSSDVNDPVQLSRQWIQLQNLRSKMKRKIDTRATKGRKIRYTAVPKLLNLMARIDWEVEFTEERKDVLFSSLFQN